jgi:hypothetical protein
MFLLCVVSASATYSDEENDGEAKSRVLRARFLSARKVEASERALKRFFDHWEENQGSFDELQFDEDPSIALEAAFASRLSRPRGSDIWQLHEGARDEFFAFFEGLTRGRFRRSGETRRLHSPISTRGHRG